MGVARERARQKIFAGRAERVSKGLPTPFADSGGGSGGGIPSAVTPTPSTQPITSEWKQIGVSRTGTPIWERSVNGKVERVATTTSPGAAQRGIPTSATTTAFGGTSGAVSPDAFKKIDEIRSSKEFDKPQEEVTPAPFKRIDELRAGYAAEDRREGVSAAKRAKYLETTGFMTFSPGFKAAAEAAREAKVEPIKEKEIVVTPKTTYRSPLGMSYIKIKEGKPDPIFGDPFNLLRFESEEEEARRTSHVEKTQSFVSGAISNIISTSAPIATTPAGLLSMSEYARKGREGRRESLVKESEEVVAKSEAAAKEFEAAAVEYQKLPSIIEGEYEQEAKSITDKYERESQKIIKEGGTQQELDVARSTAQEKLDTLRIRKEALLGQSQKFYKEGVLEPKLGELESYESRITEISKEFFPKFTEQSFSEQAKILPSEIARLPTGMLIEAGGLAYVGPKRLVDMGEGVKYGARYDALITGGTLLASIPIAMIGGKAIGKVGSKAFGRVKSTFDVSVSRSKAAVIVDTPVSGLPTAKAITEVSGRATVGKQVFDVGVETVKTAEKGKGGWVYDSTSKLSVAEVGGAEASFVGRGIGRGAIKVEKGGFVDVGRQVSVVEKVVAGKKAPRVAKGVSTESTFKVTGKTEPFFEIGVEGFEPQKFTATKFSGEVFVKGTKAGKVTDLMQEAKYSFKERVPTPAESFKQVKQPKVEGAKPSFMKRLFKGRFELEKADSLGFYRDVTGKFKQGPVIRFKEGITGRVKGVVEKGKGKIVEVQQAKIKELWRQDYEIRWERGYLAEGKVGEGKVPVRLVIDKKGKTVTVKPAPQISFKLPKFKGKPAVEKPSFETFGKAVETKKFFVERDVGRVDVSRLAVGELGIGKAIKLDVPLLTKAKFKVMEGFGKVKEAVKEQPGIAKPPEPPPLRPTLFRVFTDQQKKLGFFDATEYSVLTETKPVVKARVFTKDVGRTITAGDLTRTVEGRRLIEVEARGTQEFPLIVEEVPAKPVTVSRAEQRALGKSALSDSVATAKIQLDRLRSSAETMMKGEIRTKFTPPATAVSVISGLSAVTKTEPRILPTTKTFGEAELSIFTQKEMPLFETGVLPKSFVGQTQRQDVTPITTTTEITTTKQKLDELTVPKLGFDITPVTTTPPPPPPGFFGLPGFPSMFAPPKKKKVGVGVKTQKSYVPELRLAAFGVTKKVTRKTGLTGFEERPLEAGKVYFKSIFGR